MMLLLLLLGIPQDKPLAKVPAPAELKFAWPERIEATVETVTPPRAR